MRIILLLLCGLGLAACNNPLSSDVEKSVGRATDQVGCSNFSSSAWDVVTASLIEDNKLPETEMVLASFGGQLSQKKSDLSVQSQRQLEDSLAQFLDYFAEEFKNEKNPQKILEAVSALEVGDHSTDLAVARQKRLKAILQNLDASSVKTQQSCPAPVTPPVTEPSPVVEPLNKVVFGARKAMATAYQSCESIEKEPMTLNTPQLQGIRYDGMHDDGIGRRRFIGNLGQIQATHPYLENAYGANCVVIKNNPLIYDYGGKPATTSSETSALNFFKDAGTGTSVLGVDCSGYVFAAIASSGLKIDPNKKMKASYVHGINARMYMNPESNGLTCFEKLKVGVSGDLKAGDIIAGTGHIVIVDEAGADPLGTKQARTLAECDQITSEDFDFVVAQSSPSREGVGINRYVVSDYLIESPTFKPGLEQYAREACKGRLQNKDTLLQRADVRIIRHKQTAQCKSTPVAMTGESCILSCPGLK